MGQVTAATCLEEPYSRDVLTSEIGGLSLGTGKNTPPQTAFKAVVHRRGKDSGYSVIVKWSGKRTIWVATGGQRYRFYSDAKKAKQCNFIKMEEVRLPRQCVFFGHGSVYHTGGEGKRYIG